MPAFLLLLFAVLAIWAACSLAEAAIYSVRLPYIRDLAQSGVDAGRILLRFKENMERPIAAILIVNTIVAAAGASMAGAQASVILGESNLWWFSACFTIAALFVAEIFPKIIGVAYNRTLARMLAKPLSIVIGGLYPVIWMIERVSAVVRPKVAIAIAPETEVQQIADISAEEGSIMPYEADLVRHVLDLDKVTAREIMTPMSVVVTLPDHLKLGDLARDKLDWVFSRIPVYSSTEPRAWTGYVLSRDVLAGIARDDFVQPLQALAKPLYLVPESARGHQLLKAFLKRRTHIFAVAAANEKRVIGIVTLEDVLESLIGAEIVDELDTVVDMQSLARERKDNC